jgi:hypothetical protein
MEVVEHACPRCNSPVDDNSPFCSTCEAAQIHATPKEYSRSPIGVAVEGIPAFVSSDTLPAPRTNPDIHAELRSAFYGAIIAAVLSLIQPGAFILALPLGGFLSVLLYRRRIISNEPTNPRLGFRLGALTGLFGFGLLMVLTAVGTLSFHAQDNMHAEMVRVVHQAQARNPDPQARQVFEYFLTPQGMAFMMIVGFVFMAILFVVLSGVGGAISASLLRRKAPPGQ